MKKKMKFGCIFFLVILLLLSEKNRGIYGFGYNIFKPKLPYGFLPFFDDYNKFSIKEDNSIFIIKKNDSVFFKSRSLLIKEILSYSFNLKENILKVNVIDTNDIEVCIDIIINSNSKFGNKLEFYENLKTNDDLTIVNLKNARDTNSKLKFFNFIIIILIVLTILYNPKKNPNQFFNSIDTESI